MATPSIETKIWLALRGRVESLVLAPMLPILWPGTTTPLPSGNAIEVTNLVNRPTRTLIGSDEPHDRRGILQIGVLTTFSSNVHAETVAREIAGQVATHFVVDMPLRYEDVDVRVYEAPEVGTAIKDEARQRWMTPVSIRWHTFA